MSQHFDPVIIVDGDEYEIEDRTRNMQMELYDKNGKAIFTAVSTAESPGGIPMITTTKTISRMKRRGLSDDMICDAVDARDGNMVYDSAVRGKVEDVSFPFTNELDYYGPLTDVPAKNNIVIMSNMAGEYLSDVGVDTELFSEELSEIENVSASDGQLELGMAANAERESVASLKRQLTMARARIHNRHPEWSELPRREFIEKVMHDGAGDDGRHYLDLTQRFANAVHRIDVFAAQIMTDSVPTVHRPERVGIESLRLPEFDPTTEAFKPERLTFDQVIFRANDSLEASPLETLTPAAIGEISIDLNGI